MTIKPYTRVMPRDAFNEGNLLKCLGRLFLLCDDAPTSCELIPVPEREPFRIMQDDSTGAITATNVGIYKNGMCHLLWRPLNSREKYPLYIEDGDSHIWVFVVDNPDGILSGDFKDWIGYRKDK